MDTEELTSLHSNAHISTLHMIRANMDILEFHRWADNKGFIEHGALDEGFAMHCLLKESFGELAPKPFRLIIPRNRGGRTGTLYGYAECDSEALRDAAATFCDPLQEKVLPPSSISSKLVSSAWKSGQQLGFEVLVRPTIRRARGSNRAGTEWDAFQAEAELHPKGGMMRTREDVYTDWLRKRLEANGAARLEEATLDMFQRLSTVRKLHSRASEGPHALMHGSLTIIDTSLFSRMLAQGIGRHKSYGYGMLLLRPARRRVE